MGLEGTLKVFSLTDIFQMLGLQRKTGVLVVEGEDDTVTISFLGGQVVAAESAARRLENRLGNLLIRAGYVTQEQLDRIMATQNETQQRMGFLLVRERLVDPQELRQALRLQIARIVYTAFRWPDGRFRFSQEGMVDYDADHMAPGLDRHDPDGSRADGRRVAALREEGRLSRHGLPARARCGGLEPHRRREEPAGGHPLGREVRGRDLEVDRREALRRRHHGARVPLRLRGPQGHGRPAEPAPDRARPRRRGSRARPASGRRGVPSPSGRAIGLWAVLLLLAGVSIYVIPRNPANLLLRSPGDMPAIAEFRKAISLNRAVAIERAVRIYYDSSGRYPRSLEDLVVAGILDEDALRDPYGRFYRYILRAEDGKFGLYGRNARARSIWTSRSSAAWRRSRSSARHVPPVATP